MPEMPTEWGMLSQSGLSRPETILLRSFLLFQNLPLILLPFHSFLQIPLQFYAQERRQPGSRILSCATRHGKTDVLPVPAFVCEAAPVPVLLQHAALLFYSAFREDSEIHTSLPVSLYPAGVSERHVPRPGSTEWFSPRPGALLLSFGPDNPFLFLSCVPHRYPQAGTRHRAAVHWERTRRHPDPSCPG